MSLLKMLPSNLQEVSAKDRKRRKQKANEPIMNLLPLLIVWVRLLRRYNKP